MTNNSIDIKFRPKFRRQMKLSDFVALKKFQEFFYETLDNHESFFIGLLWNATYNPSGEKAPKKYLEFYKIFTRFSAQQQEVILSELRYQYAQLHTDFLKVDVKGEVIQSYLNLLGVADEITAYKVLQKCIQFSSYQTYVIERCSALLNSPKENVYFGGLRELGFKWLEAYYLKTYINQIRDLFEKVISESNIEM